MRVFRDILTTRSAVRTARADGAAIGLVPTMGALHRGHLALIDAAKRDGCWIIVSIFVNPTQFGPAEDFSKYPRMEADDLHECEAAEVDAVFVPPLEAMYTPGAVTSVNVAQLTETLCGPHRPGHFQGVATVVSKLFNIVQPDRAYFGEKDAQQLAVIRRMVRDLDFPIEIIGCATIREPDGLALSSRNLLLSPVHRAQATVLYAALRFARAEVASGRRAVDAITSAMREMILAGGPATIDYVSIVDPESLQPVSMVERNSLAALAVRIGGVRLIDNVMIEP